MTAQNKHPSFSSTRVAAGVVKVPCSFGVEGFLLGTPVNSRVLFTSTHSFVRVQPHARTQETFISTESKDPPTHCCPTSRAMQIEEERIRVAEPNLDNCNI